MAVCAKAVERLVRPYVAVSLLLDGLLACLTAALIVRAWRNPKSAQDSFKSERQKRKTQCRFSASKRSLTASISVPAEPACPPSLDRLWSHRDSVVLVERNRSDRVLFVYWKRVVLLCSDFRRFLAIFLQKFAAASSPPRPGEPR